MEKTDTSKLINLKGMFKLGHSNVNKQNSKLMNESR